MHRNVSLPLLGTHGLRSSRISSDGSRTLGLQSLGSVRGLQRWDPARVVLSSRRAGRGPQATRGPSPPRSRLLALVLSVPFAGPAGASRARRPHQIEGSRRSRSSAPRVVHPARAGVFVPAVGVAHRDVVLGARREGSEPGEGGKHLSQKLATPCGRAWARAGRSGRAGQGVGDREGVSGKSNVLLTGWLNFCSDLGGCPQRIFFPPTFRRNPVHKTQENGKAFCFALGDGQ